MASSSSSPLQSDKSKVQDLLQENRLPEARDLCLRLSEHFPDDAELWSMLGTVNGRLGLLHEAQQCFQQAVAREPANAGHHFLLGKALEFQTRYEDAARCYEEALRRRPEFAEAHCHLGNTLLVRGRLDEAVEHYKKAVVLEPGLAEAHANLGGSLLRQKHLDAAEASLRTAIALNPGLAEAYHHLGDFNKLQGNVDSAVDSYRRALELKPALPETLNNLGCVLFNQYELERAAEYFRDALRFKPSLAEAHFNLANVLQEQGWIEQAIQSCAEAIRINPRYVDAYCNLGRLHKARGRLDEALSCYRTAMDLAPGNAEAVAGLAGLYELQGDDEKAVDLMRPLIDVGIETPEAAIVFARLCKHTNKYSEAAETMERLLHSDRLNAAQQASLHFELGSTYDRLKKFDRAFEHYRTGNELKRKARHYAPAQHARYIDELVRTFSAEFVQGVPRATHGSRRPLFIVGMPRSGTTLIEQIMNSHPAVHGAGEISAISEIAASLAKVTGTAYPGGVDQLNRDQCDRLARPYLDLIATFSPTAEYVTDKMPNNFLHLGLINLLFPGARIIHCTRDPRDTCLSCYFYDFVGQDNYFAYDLAWLGDYYTQYRRLMDHWKTVLDLPMLEIRYEDLVADQEPVTRRMIDFCDLEWDPECLNFHENRRVVTTASYSQVRQPLYTGSIGRWKRYERHLGPLIDALGRSD